MDFLNPASNPTGFTIFIVGVTVVIIAASFVWRMKWQKGLLTGGMEGGSAATGIITGIGQTGTYINDQPRMTFTVQVQPAPAGVPYTAEIKQTIPVAFLGMLAPGRQVALLVSPNDPSKVKIDLQGTANLASVAGFAGAAAGVGPAGVAPAPGAWLGAAAAAGGGGQVRSNDQLVTSVPAIPATVVSMQETGQTYGTDPIVILDLQLQTSAGPRPLKAAYRVPADRRPRLMPGTVLRAHPDPADPAAAGIDWRAL